MPGSMSASISRTSALARMALHWRILRSERLPYEPLEISIEPTNRCNFKCSFCVQSDPTHLERVGASALSADEAGRLIRRLREAGIRAKVIHWTLDGEPFMNKGFAEIARVAVEHGFDTHHFASNGALMTPERLLAFPTEGVRYYITPDFCSSESYFEKVRGTPGSWRTVRDNIRAVLADERLAAFHFKVTDISSYDIADPEELDRRFEELKALFPQSERISFHRRVFHNMAGYLDLDKKRGDYQVCPYPWESFVVASNGDVVACCRDLERRTVLGNLHQQTFDEIWNGERYRALRRDLASGHPERQAACRDCDMPWDSAKFSARNLVKFALHRLLLFERKRS